MICPRCEHEGMTYNGSHRDPRREWHCPKCAFKWWTEEVSAIELRELRLAASARTCIPHLGKIGETAEKWNRSR